MEAVEIGLDTEHYSPKLPIVASLHAPDEAAVLYGAVCSSSDIAKF